MLVVLEVLIVIVVRIMQQGSLNRDIGKPPRRLAAPVMQRLAKRDDPSDMTCGGTLLLSSAFLGVLLSPGWNVFSVPFVTASGEGTAPWRRNHGTSEGVGHDPEGLYP